MKIRLQKFRFNLSHFEKDLIFHRNVYPVKKAPKVKILTSHTFCEFRPEKSNLIMEAP